MKIHPKTLSYQPPFLYPFLFYFALSVWTIISVFYLVSKFWQPGKGELTQSWIMFFIVVITWYFSISLCYKIEIGEEGVIRLYSFRRVIQTSPSEINLIQGPVLPLGFIRFRLEREKVYLFCLATSKDLHEVLSFVCEKNRNIHVKSL